MSVINERQALTWNEAIGVIVADLSNDEKLPLTVYSQWSSDLVLGDLRQEITSLARQIKFGVSQPIAVDYKYMLKLALAGMLGDLEPGAYEAQLRYISALACRKHHDYGRENIETFGHLGLIVRISDKIARLKNLVGKNNPLNETLDDSWNDIIGYALIGLMLLDGTFSLPLANG